MRRAQLKALGNACVPQVVAMIGRTIMAAVREWSRDDVAQPKEVTVSDFRAHRPSKTFRRKQLLLEGVMDKDDQVKAMQTISRTMGKLTDYDAQIVAGWFKQNYLTDRPAPVTSGPVPAAGAVEKA